MSGKYSGVELSSSLQEAVCKENGIEYNPDRKYNFENSIGGILLKEYSKNGDVLEAYYIKSQSDRYRPETDKFLVGTLPLLQKEGRKTLAAQIIILAVFIITVAASLLFAYYIL